METKNLEVKKTARGIRIWVEDIKSGAQMADNGFTRGVKYTRTIDSDNGVITLAVDPNGPLKVAGKDGKNAIIDISAKAIDGFAIGDRLEASFEQGIITIVNREKSE